MQANSNGNGIGFQGKSYNARKLYLHGTPRFNKPEETLEKVTSIAKTIGVTRLANITGLDRVGIPTIMATRPAALVPSVSWGKGLTTEQAVLSAAMESIERYHGENACPESFAMSYDDLAASYPVIALENMPLTNHAVFSRKQQERWVMGWDIANQRETAVPRGLISLLHFSEPTGLASFQISSNGLAAGTHLLEAIFQALIEVMERDAVTCHYSFAQDLGIVGLPDRVRLDTIPYQSVQELIGRLTEVKIKPLLFDCSVDTDVPVFTCYIYDQTTRYSGISKGYGASLDPEVAMIRAITEAAQSRVSHMAGTLDNTPYHDFHFARMNDNARVIQGLESLEEKVDGGRHQSHSTATFEGDIRLCIEKLAGVGLDQVIVFDLTMPGLEISIVKVIVPGLEGYRHRYYSPGHRAEAFCIRRNP